MVVPAALNTEETENVRRGEGGGSPCLRPSEPSVLSAAGIRANP